MTFQQYQESNRGTGRTQRMLEAAQEAANAGEDVVIVASNHVHQNYLSSLTALPVIRASQFEWTSMRMPGKPANTQYFIDHQTIEERFFLQLEQLMRFNNGSEAVESTE